MKAFNGWTLCVLATILAAQAADAAQVTFYEGEGFRGRAFTTRKPVARFTDHGFNDRASSLVVGSGDWLVCEDVQYRGRCVLVRRGAYDSLQRMGLSDRISSVRAAPRGNRDYAAAPEPLPEPDYEYRRRPDERVYEARVTSVRAVVGQPEGRCWLEQERVPARSGANVGGAVAGAILGGILGHQIGGGRGRDAATVGGVVAGGVVGANVHRDAAGETWRDVQRCEQVADVSPEYWDVRYEYRGIEHFARMTAPPGRTLHVSRNGEPRQ